MLQYKEIERRFRLFFGNLLIFGRLVQRFIAHAVKCSPMNADSAVEVGTLNSL
jgi:hypothetical protein